MPRSKPRCSLSLNSESQPVFSDDKTTGPSLLSASDTRYFAGLISGGLRRIYMPVDLSDTLVVGISSTALYDLSEADRLFRERTSIDRDKGMEEYRNYMLARENEPLAPGTGHPLVRALLKLNQYCKAGEPPLVEVVVMSRNSPETGLRILNTIRHEQLPITRSAFTGGQSVVPYLEAFDVDLFLTTNTDDAKQVIDGRVCAVGIVLDPPRQLDGLPEDEIRIAFDGDAVLFDEASEVINQKEGLAAFHKSEDQNKEVPLGEGPHASFLRKLARLKERLSTRVEYSPLRLAIVTSRNTPAEMRVIKTLRHWGVYVDQIFFLGGLAKDPVLKALKPHIFFDDQESHLVPAHEFIPSARVPYPSASPLLETGQDAEGSKGKA